MRRRDRERWASARTLADLGDVTVAWLAGEVRETPGHCGPPQAETIPYLGVLAAVNQAGFVTTNSQAAGPSWEAWVDGFAMPATVTRLHRAAAGTPVTIVPLAHGRREELRWYGRVCHSDAVACLRAARFIHVSDPRPKHNDVLWPALARLSGNR